MRNLLEDLDKLAQRGDCTITVAYREAKPDEGAWSAAATWGREAPDSSMAAAAAYGMGDSSAAAIEQLLDEAGV